jgi:hypothetical protein
LIFASFLLQARFNFSIGVFCGNKKPASRRVLHCRLRGDYLIFASFYTKPDSTSRLEYFAAIKNPPLGGFFIAACAVIT